jgi:hypothetical protein
VEVIKQVEGIKNHFEGDNRISPFAFVYVTHDYELFEFIKGNRDVANVNKLKKSIKENGYLNYPIIVTISENGKLLIADGQHRFTVCKEMNLPIFFVIQNSFTIKQIQVANTAQQGWSLANHIQSQAETSADYARFYQMLQNFDFSSGIVHVAMGGGLTSGVVDKTIKDGRLKCTEQQYEEGTRILAWLTQFKEDLKRNGIKGSRESFWTGMIFAYKNSLVNNQLLAKRIHNNFFKFNGYVASNEDAIQKISDAYNYKVSPENQIDLLAEYRKAVREASCIERQKKDKK